MNEDMKTNEMLKEELKKQMNEYYEHVKYLEAKIERLNGIIEGLKFAIRCDGVSGADVR